MFLKLNFYKSAINRIIIISIFCFFFNNIIAQNNDALNKKLTKDDYKILEAVIDELAKDEFNVNNSDNFNIIICDSTKFFTGGISPTDNSKLVGIKDTTYFKLLLAFIETNKNKTFNIDKHFVDKIQRDISKKLIGKCSLYVYSQAPYIFLKKYAFASLMYSDKKLYGAGYFYILEKKKKWEIIFKKQTMVI